MEFPSPSRTGSVMVDIQYGWDGVSVMPNCDGPITSLRTRNTSTDTAWALLPNKKKVPLWVQIDPGTDSTITAAGTLKNLGLTNCSDVLDASVVYTQPA